MRDNDKSSSASLIIDSSVPVAQYQEEYKKKLSMNESLPIYYKIIDMIYLSSTDESFLYNPLQIIEELFSFVESLGTSSQNRVDVLKYVIKNRAVSPPVIMNDLNIAEASLYRSIDELVEKGFIVWATTATRSKKKKGYACGIIAIPNFTPEDLINARQSEVERNKPKSIMVQKAYQLLLDEYSDKEPTRQQVITRLKPKLSGYAILDIIGWIDSAIELAHKNKKIKIWC